MPSLEELAPLRDKRPRWPPLVRLGRVGPAEQAEGAASASPAPTSRWNRGKDLSWEPLCAERVAEVAYDHLQGDRFRHGDHVQALAPRQAGRRGVATISRGRGAPYLLASIFGGVGMRNSKPAPGSGAGRESGVSGSTGRSARTT